VKLSDAVLGLLLLALSAAVPIASRGFHAVPGQNIGPGAFPQLVASLLAFCAVLLMLRAARSGQLRPWLLPGAWLRLAPQRRAFVVCVGGMLLYVGLSDRMGFIPCGVALLLALGLALRQPWQRVVPQALLAPLVIHTIFYKGLKVPLPWGLLSGVAW